MLDNLKILISPGQAIHSRCYYGTSSRHIQGKTCDQCMKKLMKMNWQKYVLPMQSRRIPFVLIWGNVLFAENVLLLFHDKIKFTTDYKIATNERKSLIIKEGNDKPIELNPELIRKEISEYFSGSLKLRQVSAGGDNSCELELNACGNVNFDMGRFGIEFVASPRHADGIVITGPITENMAQPLQICYDAIPEPKIIILAGTDAISGGIFEGSLALNRSFLSKYKIDLYVPGNPIHPLTFINGVLELIRKRK